MKSRVDPICFARRPDGKFYRGAKFYRWTRSWRRAALLSKSVLVWHMSAHGIDPDSIRFIETDFNYIDS